MDTPAARIHDSLETVARLRAERLALPVLAEAVLDVKRFQARRFQATYSDVLIDTRYRTAAAFFLNELYSDKDYAERDLQFAKIATTMAALFPPSVVETAGALAELHSLTEELDQQMAVQWLAYRNHSTGQGPGQALVDACARYVASWREVANPTGRKKQLQSVLQLGHKIDRLTKKPGLGTLLKLMRRPAAAAGLRSLQSFLEAGFAAFAGMRGSEEFLKIIETREDALMQSLYQEDLVACESKLQRLMVLGWS